tara:strand:- start:7 stop:546 length:540 start_codon:yes stop_codon:yes gene_type:complete
MDTTQEIKSLIDQVDKVSEIEEIQGNFLKKAHELLDRDIQKAQAFIQRAEDRKVEIEKLFGFARDYERSHPAVVQVPVQETPEFTPKTIAEKIEEDYLPGIDRKFTNNDVRDYLVEEYAVPESVVNEKTKCGNIILSEKVRKAIMRLAGEGKIDRVSPGRFQKTPAASSNNFFKQVTTN